MREIMLDRWDDFNANDLSLSLYFNPDEEKQFDKKVKKQDKIYDIVLSEKEWHLQVVGDYSIITIFKTIDDIAKWSNNNKFNYNPETQRDLVIIEKDGIPIVKLDINWNSIKAMKKLMARGIYYPVTGIININPEESEELPKFRGTDLIISDKCKMDLCEGFHNLIATTQYKNEHPDWEFPCKYEIVMMNKEGINNVIRQMNEKNPFNKEQAARMDTGVVSYLINTLNKRSDFYLNGICDKDIFYFLYRLLPMLFKVGDKISKSELDLLDELVEKLKIIIKTTNHFDKSFTKEEWFIFLLLIKYCNEDKLDIRQKISDINIEYLKSEIKIIDMPIKKHYNLVKSKVKEVKNNV
jgi:hypothetical protein